MDLDHARLRGAVVTSRRWVVVATFRRVAFSSRKATLVARNKAN